MINFSKASLITVAVFGIGVFSANAADQGHGKIAFDGAIVDAPCSITPDASDQTVDMGQISNVALQQKNNVKPFNTIGGGKSTPINFSIDLENCTFGTPASRNKVTVTFTGIESSSNNGMLGITGTAKGASLALASSDGELINLGVPTKEQGLQDGHNTLAFSAYLQGDSEATSITEGDFQAVTDFTLAYN